MNLKKIVTVVLSISSIAGAVVMTSVSTSASKSDALSYSARWSGDASPSPYHEYNPYYDAAKGTLDCTNYVSQLMYVSGYQMNGGPGSSSSFSGNGNENNAHEWYYRKVIDKNGSMVYRYSSSWNVVEYNRGFVAMPYGLAKYLSNQCIPHENLVSWRSDFINYYDVRQGDVIQLDQDHDRMGVLDHSIYIHNEYSYPGGHGVWYTGHTNDRFMESLGGIYANNPTCRFTVWHTSWYCS